MDAYTWKSRVAPALLTAAPIIALGIALLPILSGVSKLWTILTLGLTTYAALTARRAGNQIQPELLREWGGWPTTSRLRFRDNPSATEISRRHSQIERILQLSQPLPTPAEESTNPDTVDAEYDAVVSRIKSLTRDSNRFNLLNLENSNYGFTRNLLGLKYLGISCCVGTFGIAVVAGLALHNWRDWHAASPLALPAAIAIISLFLWTQVDDRLVKPSADAYADRLIDALDELAKAA
jgi:hypothetical protein